MCELCWQEYGKPQSNNPKVIEAVSAIELIYEYHLAGGGLHIILDDWNLDDGSLRFCRKYIEDTNYDVDPEQLQAELTCLELFEKLSENDRAAALGLREGYYEL
jgi:hypothetical protein